MLPVSLRRGGAWGAEGVKNFSVGICNGAPLTAHSSSIFAKGQLQYWNLKRSQKHDLEMIKYMYPLHEKEPGLWGHSPHHSTSRALSLVLPLPHKLCPVNQRCAKNS